MRTSIIDAPKPSRAVTHLLTSRTTPDWIQKAQLTGYVLRYLEEGEEKFRTSDHIFTLEAGQFLILNPETVLTYTPLTQQVKGLWVWLDKQFVSQTFQQWSLQSPGEWQSLISEECGYPEWCEHTYAAEHNPLGQVLSTFHSLQEQELLQALFTTQQHVFAQMAQLTSAKLSTKMELYRRLCQARNYIHHNLDTSLDLDTLAQVACLSKFHFIRLFKEAFGQTPRQYLIGHRLEHARRLLLNSSKTFHEICQEVGLKDSSSFGRLFKRNYGATPQIYRQMHAVA
ncbi:MAG: AraC family transcriptional regulator [Bacteroidota bacterium]